MAQAALYTRPMAPNTFTLIERIRTGDWVTAKRRRIYPRLVLAVCLAPGPRGDHPGPGQSGQCTRPPWARISSASGPPPTWSPRGRPAAAYDHTALQALEQSLTGPDGPLYTWLYPPMALLVVAPLAALPYPAALAAWLGLTLAGYLTALWRLLPDRRALLPMLAFPPLFINLGHGQNAFLSAALLGWGLLLLPRCPWLAGIFMGTLIYKPQLGLLLPVALLAAGQWRAFLGAGLAALAFAVATYGLWGPEVWTAFLAKSDYARQMLEQGLVPWYKMTSVFAAARLLGAEVGVAWALQGLASLIAAATVWRLWRGPAPYPLKVAALAMGSLLAAPLALDYDATLLGLALAAWVADGRRRGFGDWEISALALAWMSPLFWRPLAQVTAMPLGALTLILLLWLATRRARRVLKPGKPPCPISHWARRA
jgi:alpha-1,2-mannosyltransferase